MIQSSDSPPGIAILGLGAIGTLMAWHWRSCSPYSISRAGNGEERQITDLQQQQHQLTLPEWQNQPLQWLVITTKAADTLAALTPVRDKLHLVENILLLQNGMGQQKQIDDWLHSANSHQPELWVGTSTEGAYRDSRQHIIYAGNGETLIAPWHATAPVTTSALIKTSIVGDIHQRLFDKLAINAVINPLTGSLRCRNGELVSNSAFLAQLNALADEVSAFFQHQNWPLSFNLRDKAQQVATATANNQSSTLQDVIQRRKTELEFICGFLLEQAKPTNYPLPITERLYKALI